MSRGAEHKKRAHGRSALEALKLALWQRLSQLKHPRHVLAVIREEVAGHAASEMGAGRVQNVKGR